MTFEDREKGFESKYAHDEEYAKINNLGIWKMKFDYPWEWRKKNK